MTINEVLAEYRGEDGNPRWAHPQTAEEMPYGAHGDKLRAMIPCEGQIPEEYWSAHGSSWARFVSRWFF